MNITIVIGLKQNLNTKEDNKYYKPFRKRLKRKVAQGLTIKGADGFNAYGREQNQYDYAGAGQKD